MATTTQKKATTKNPVSKSSTKKSLLQRLKDMRADRKARRAEKRRKKQTEEARKARAEKRAVRKKALEQVQEAVTKSKQRRSYPGLLLLFLIIIIGLSGAAVWQYRQIEIDEKQSEITELQSEIASFADQQAALEAARRAEEARFRNLSVNEANVRVPAEWETKPSQLPDQEVIIGDNNVTLTVVNSENRNSIETFIPKVDYLWIMEASDDSVQVASQSLHCNRFDTLDNNLDNPLREHQGFQVFCDDNQEVVKIVVLNSPENYGILASNTYFMIEIADLQQVNFADLQDYIESYNL